MDDHTESNSSSDGNLGVLENKAFRALILSGGDLILNEN